MKMTERFESSSTTTSSSTNSGGAVINNNNNNNNSSADLILVTKHKRLKNSSKSSSSSATTMIENNNSVFIDNPLSVDTSLSPAAATIVNGQQLPMEIATSSSSLSSPTKPLKIVLKVGHAGSYSPASSTNTTTTSFLNNNTDNNHVVINNDISKDSRIFSIGGDNNSPSSSSSLTPPELLPLNSDAFHHNVDFQQIDRINNNNRKAKKKKKKHHHHHHHHNHHHHNHNNNNNHDLTSSNSILDNTNHNDHQSQTNSIDQSKELNNSSSSSSSSNNNNNTSIVNDFVNNVKNVNNNNNENEKTLQITDSLPTTTTTSSNNIIKNSLSNVDDQTVNNNNSDCMELSDGHSFKENSIVFPEQTDKTIQHQESVEMIDDNDEDNDEEDDDVILSMNQDSIFSSVDLIDVDSCSKLDISALVPDDGDEMIGELNNGGQMNNSGDDSQQSAFFDLKSSGNNNKDIHRKLKSTSSVYRQLLQKGYVRCDSNNLYEHLRRCEKMKNSLTKFRKSSSSSNQIVFQNFLLSLLKRLEMKDPQKLFAWPVIDSLTPGYSQIVKHPMDFNTIRKKIEHNIYQSVAELKYDVRLLCENAIRYYRHSGMHYCQASRLWYFAKTRIFARDQLAEQLKQFPPLTISDLGMDNPNKISLNKLNGTNTTISTTTTSSIITNGISSANVKKFPETLTLQSLLNDTKCEPMLNQVDYKNGFTDCFNDTEELIEQTPQQILLEHQQKLQQQQSSSATTNSTTAVEIPELTLLRPENNKNIIFNRQNEDGTTTLPFIIDNRITNDQSNDNDHQIITLGHLTGTHLNEGTTSLPIYQLSEMERIYPYNYTDELLKNSFISHLPYMNSDQSTINHNDTLLLFNTFDKFEQTKHNEEIERIANDGEYLMKSYVDSLLSIVSNGDYQPPPNTPPTESITDMDLDLCSVDNIDENSEESEKEDLLQKRLKETKQLLENLEEIQQKRLKQTNEPIQPSSDEIEVADKVTTSLVDIIKQWFNPQDIVDDRIIHQNLGIEFNFDDNDDHNNQTEQQSPLTDQLNNH